MGAVSHLNADFDIWDRFNIFDRSYSVTPQKMTQSIHHETANYISGLMGYQRGQVNNKIILSLIIISLAAHSRRSTFCVRLEIHVSYWVALLVFIISISWLCYTTKWGKVSTPNIQMQLYELARPPALQVPVLHWKCKLTGSRSKNRPFPPIEMKWNLSRAFSLSSVWTN